MTSRTWTHGCDACGADAPVTYQPEVAGYLCAACLALPPEALLAPQDGPDAPGLDSSREKP